MATSFIKEQKPITTYTKEQKPTTAYTKNGGIDFLLKEDGFYLLLETGGKIVIRRGYVMPIYTKEIKP